VVRRARRPLPAPDIVTSEHDAVGVKNVVQHPTFTQELGIADDRKCGVPRRVLGHDAGD
jgi:hypothetical protein